MLAEYASVLVWLTRLLQRSRRAPPAAAAVRIATWQNWRRFPALPISRPAARFDLARFCGIARSRTGRTSAPAGPAAAMLRGGSDLPRQAVEISTATTS